MKAIIMAGGKGTRLRPLTYELPKPMVPVMNVPVMEHIIELLKLHGITEIGVTLMFLPQKIKNYFGDGSNFGVKIEYFMEDIPLGTAGSIKNAESFLDDTFVVISGDCMTDINLSEVIEFHVFKQALSTLVLTRVDVPLDYGVVITDNSSHITQFMEKPTWGEVFSDTVNTGIYVMEPEILKYLHKGIPCDFSRELFPSLLDKNKPLYGYTTFDYWTDIGNLESYMKTHHDILDGKVRINFRSAKKRDNVWEGKNTIVEPNAKINSPCYIGSNCRIGNGAVIDSLTVIGDNCIIEDEVSIKRSILWNNCSVDFGAELRGCLLANRVQIKHYVSCFENSVIGDESVIHERAIIKPNIKIWPQKTISSLSVVDRNIVWGAKQTTSLFGQKGLSGILNVDITPEFASRLGAAYGSIIGKNKTVVVSSDNANPSRMFKYAFIAGLLSVGIKIYNMSGLITPLARQAIHLLNVSGGIHVKCCEDSSERIRVDFMDETGAASSRILEKNIQNSFYKEDFKRCTADDIQELNNVTDFPSYYSRHLLNITDIEAIKIYQPRICISSSSDAVLSILGSILDDIGCEILVKATNPSIDYIHKKATEVGADFAALIDCNGEQLTLIDKTGRSISDNLLFLFTSYILYKSVPGYEIIAPVNTTSVLEQLAQKYNGSVKWSKTMSNFLLNEMMKKDVFADNLNQYILQYDALSSLVKIIEYLSKYNTTIENTIKFIPSFHVQSTFIHCPWDQIGKVMRTLITEQHQNKIELLDGIKVFYPEGWVLMLPDTDNPQIHIYAEGKTHKLSKILLEDFQARIQKIVETIE